MVFPITPLEGWSLFLYPLTAFSWYWGVIVTTFYSRWSGLMGATRPSDEFNRILRPAKHIVRMQILVFVFMFLSAAGLIRFAVSPVLIFYFFPFPIFREKLMYLFDKWDAHLNRIPPPRNLRGLTDSTRTKPPLPINPRLRQSELQKRQSP